MTPLNNFYSKLEQTSSGLPVDYSTVYELSDYSEGSLRLLELQGLVRYTRTGIEVYAGGYQKNRI